MTGYDRGQLTRAENLLLAALRQVRLARERPDDAVEVLSRCMYANVNVGDAARALDVVTRRMIDRRRAVS